MIGKCNLSKGGGTTDVVNGIIEQYLAESDTIDAGTFVEFVNHFQDNIIVESYVYLYFSAVLIDTSKIFIVFQKSSELYGIICTINGGQISTSSYIKIADSSTYKVGQIPKIASIDTNKVFIVFQHQTYDRVYGVVCTVSGTTITVGTSKVMSSSSRYHSSSWVSITKVDTNKVFITYSALPSSYYYQRAIVCTISGTTITTGNELEIGASISFTGDNMGSVAIDCCSLSTTKVFVARGYSPTASYLYGTICTISGTTITINSSIALISSNNTSKSNKVIKLDDDKVFITHEATSNGSLNGIICTINNTTISQGTDTVLSSKNSSANYNYAVLISSNKVGVFHYNGVDAPGLSGLICTINSYSITSGIDTVIKSGSAVSANNSILVDTNKVFIMHPNNNTNMYLSGIFAYIDDMDILTDTDHRTIKASEDRIHGLTKTSATTSSAGDVWVLDTE